MANIFGNSTNFSYKENQFLLTKVKYLVLY